MNKAGYLVLSPDLQHANCGNRMSCQEIQPRSETLNSVLFFCIFNYPALPPSIFESLVRPVLTRMSTLCASRWCRHPRLIFTSHTS